MFPRAPILCDRQADRQTDKQGSFKSIDKHVNVNSGVDIVLRTGIQICIFVRILLRKKNQKKYIRDQIRAPEFRAVFKFAHPSVLREFEYD